MIRHRRPRKEQVTLAVLLVGTLVLFTWNLAVSGAANVYYTAAAQAGAESWKAMFFGSLDASNAITVDKPPLGLWPIALSVRMFGLSSWSVLVPQALEGVACVALVHACVRRSTGSATAALLGGIVFASTPVTALVFRYNNPDAMLTLLLVGAAYAVLRALESPRPTQWLVLAGTLCGLGFLTKMLEALIVVPALALTYLVHGGGPVGPRLARLVTAGIALVVAAGWWVALVELWPASERPFVGGSPANSVVQLALGYNGLDRITGTSNASNASNASNGFSATNLARIGRTDVGGEVMWLVPAAVFLGLLALVVSRRDIVEPRVRASLTMWSSWFLFGLAVFAGMAGIFHSYYTVILAPAVAAVSVTGAWLAWERRTDPAVRLCMAGTMLATTVQAAATVAVDGGRLAWMAAPLAVGGLAGTGLLLPRLGVGRISALVTTAVVISALAAPSLFTVETVRLPHVGPGPMAGPAHGATSTSLVAGSSSPSTSPAGYRPLAPGVVAALGAGSASYAWVAAAMGAKSAAAYELATGAPVLAIGGYKGTDPLPTLDRFQTLVAAGRVHWLVPGGTTGSAGRAIQAWVALRFSPVVIDEQLLYDLTAPLSLTSGSAQWATVARR